MKGIKSLQAAYKALGTLIQMILEILLQIVSISREKLTESQTLGKVEKTTQQGNGI
jgi:hypothetical protein